MAYEMPPLNWLRAFEATSRHLSFTHAASELGLSQVAVSKQVKHLELRLNEKLFVRHARSLTLTKTAEAYLPKVKDAFERLSDGTNEVFGNRRSKVLTLRAAVGFAVNWLAPKLPDFYARFPDIPLRVISSVWNEEIGSKEYDLDIRYGTGKWRGMRADRLTHDSIMPVFSPNLMPMGSPADLLSLANHPLIHVMGYEEGWATWLRAAKVEGVDAGSGIQVDTSLMAFDLAASMCGIAIARSSLVERDFQSGRLIAPFDLKVPIEEAFYLVSSDEGYAHADADQFRGWLMGAAQ